MNPMTPIPSTTRPDAAASSPVVAGTAMPSHVAGSLFGFGSSDE